jgi:hypothetical protein
VVVATCIETVRKRATDLQYRHVVTANWWKESRHIPPTTAAAGMLRKKCSRRRNHRKRPKTKLEGCSLPNFKRKNVSFVAAVRNQTKQQRQQEEVASGPKPQKLKHKETDRSVPATIVNSEPQDKALKTLTVVHQIMKELKGAASEEHMALTITKIVMKLMKEDGK